jgi:hypothetical protein
MSTWSLALKTTKKTLQLQGTSHTLRRALNEMGALIKSAPYVHATEAVTANEPPISLQENIRKIFIIHVVDATTTSDWASTVREIIKPWPTPKLRRSMPLRLTVVDVVDENRSALEPIQLELMTC